ncbi:MAG: 2-C-methyl-D-erythritol 2,4-cyclodiphosphate synthase [Sedimenticolaceae bacterium]|jgi:2-C-methyl-D-erythritol 2,4-cyclodiphosphate synthase
MRIGHGFDAHRFGEGDSVTIGGISIPHSQGLIAHSDGDVLIHAICDAILGAMALGDIGKHFPDNDPAFKNIDSAELLKSVMQSANKKGYVVGNLDCTVIAQAPRLGAHIYAMQTKLAGLLNIEVDAVNVKATTTEKMGYTGRGEGISAHAVVLMQPQ